MSQNGHPQYRWEVSLRLSHPAMDIGALLHSHGMEGRFNRLVGQPRTTPLGRPLEGVYSNSSCHLDFDLTPAESLEATLQEVLDYLVTKHQVFDSIAATGGSAELIIGFFMDRPDTGFILDSPLLQLCARLKLQLSFYIYAPD